MILVLFSGGVDSMVLAEMARQKGILGGLLFIGYSQPAISEEMRAAKRYAALHGYELHIIHAPVRGVHDVMAIGPGVDGLRILPGRNLVMIAHALNVAKVLGCSGIWYGANAGDTEYPDCTPDFLQAVNHVGKIDTGITVSAPLIYKSKAQIKQLAAQIGLDLSASWSCYEPTRLGDPCGECHSCQEAAACGVCDECKAGIRCRELSPPGVVPGSCCDDPSNRRRDATTGALDCVSCGAELERGQGWP